MEENKQSVKGVQFPDEATRDYAYTHYFKTTKKGIVTKAEFCRSIIVAYLNGDVVWKPQPNRILWGSEQVTFKKQPDANWKSDTGEIRTDDEIKESSKRTFVKETLIKT